MKRYVPRTRAGGPALAATLAALLWPAAGPAAEAPGPTSTVSVGVGEVTPDNQRFGQYTGLEVEGADALIDLDLNHLNPDTGTWLQLRGRDLGLQSRELRLRGERQGDWGYTLEYRDIPRAFPYAIDTALQGAGTASLTTNVVAPGGGDPLRLGTDRQVVQAGVDKALGHGLDVKVTFRNEQKDGTRLFGRTGINFLVEPIDYATRQWETVLSYTGERLQLAGGYYGTAFQNANRGLVVDGVTDGNNSTYSPIGLPPDNVSHQLSVNGGYNFSPATRGDFQLAYGRITQDDAFIPTVTVAPGVGGDLNGEIRTLRTELGLTSRPTADLTVTANARREARDDRTPVLVYYSGTGATSRTNGENEPRDFIDTAGKVEAVYRLPAQFRVTGGVNLDHMHRNISAVRSASMRATTNETAYRVELGRSMSGDLDGTVAYIFSVRDGSAFPPNLLNGGGSGSDNIAPIHYSDRHRDQVRATLAATPSDRVALQLVGDAAWDRYDSRTDQNLGPRNGIEGHVSADATVQVARDWNVTAFVSRDHTSQKQNSCDGIDSAGAPCAAASYWRAELNNWGYAGGLSVRGKAGRRVALGADVQTSYDKGRYDQAGTPVTQAIPGLYYKPMTVSAFGDLALDAHSGVGLSATYNRQRTNDWSWVTWSYADGTTLYQDPKEDVVFVGVRYHRTWL